MTHDDVMTKIRNSRYRDWTHDEIRQTLALKSDLDIVMKYEDDGDFYDATWMQHIRSQPIGTGQRYEVFYKGIYIDEFRLVLVDGCRARVPIPKPGTKAVTTERYELARAVDQQNSLNSYVEICGLSVA